MSIISVVRTDSYEEGVLDAAVARHFEALGVAEDIFPGIKILIKPNLLAAFKPDQTVTTHPLLIGAVIRWLRAHGAEDITLADSPGGPYISASLSAVYSASGMKSLEGLCKLNYDTGWRAVSCPSGYVNRSFNIINPILEADYIINMPKLKTHGMTTMSAGIKNLFGAIPGLQKPELHYRFPETRDFCNMLVELASVVKPSVTIMDAVYGMEGNGPSGGTSRHVGVTFASRDVFNQDYFAATLMGIDPESVEMLNISAEKGLIKPEEITLTGDNVPPCEPPFKLPDTKTLDFLGYIPSFIKRPVKALLSVLLRTTPRVNKSICIGCAKCAESCPPQIISIVDKKAVIDLKNCISCFCCHEMCPVRAIDVKRRLKL